MGLSIKTNNFAFEVKVILGLESTIPDGSGRDGRGQAENKTNSAQLELELGLSLAIKRIRLKFMFFKYQNWIYQMDLYFF